MIEQSFSTLASYSFYRYYIYMKILFRHLFINMILPLMYLILSFTILFIVADLMENGVDFYKSNSPIEVLINYYILQLPIFLKIIIPICLLLATLYSLSVLTRNGELIAMRASGISIQTIIKPYVLIGLVCFCIISFIEEFTPQNKYLAEQLKQSHKKTDQVIRNKIDYVNTDLNHYWYIQEFNTELETMGGITLRKRRADGSDLEKIVAKRGYWFNEKWWFEEGYTQKFNPQNQITGSPKKFQINEMRDLPEKPINFIVDKKPEYLRTSELIKLLRTNSNLSIQNQINNEIALHQKFSSPFMCIIAILLGIPLGTHTGRRSMSSGIMLSIVLFFSFYGISFLMEYLSRTQAVIPFIGIWMTTVLFIFAGGYYISKTN